MVKHCNKYRTKTLIRTHCPLISVFNSGFEVARQRSSARVAVIQSSRVSQVFIQLQRSADPQQVWSLSVCQRLKSNDNAIEPQLCRPLCVPVERVGTHSGRFAEGTHRFEAWDRAMNYMIQGAAPFEAVRPHRYHFCSITSDRYLEPVYKWLPLVIGNSQ